MRGALTAPSQADGTLGRGGRFLHRVVRGTAAGMVLLAFLGPWLDEVWTLLGWALAIVALLGGCLAVFVYTVVRLGPAKRRAFLVTAGLVVGSVPLAFASASAGAAFAFEARRPDLDALADALEKDGRIRLVRGDPLDWVNNESVWEDGTPPDALSVVLAREGIDPATFTRVERLRKRAGAPDVDVEAGEVFFIYRDGDAQEGLLRVRPGETAPRLRDQDPSGYRYTRLHALGGRWYAFVR